MHVGCLCSQWPTWCPVPISIYIQARQKPDTHAASGKVRMLDVHSTLLFLFFPGRSWEFSPNHTVCVCSSPCALVCVACACFCTYECSVWGMCRERPHLAKAGQQGGVGWLCPGAGEERRRWPGGQKGWEDTNLEARKCWTLLCQALSYGTSHTPTKNHSRGLQLSLSYCTLRHKHPHPPDPHPAPGTIVSP